MSWVFRRSSTALLVLLSWAVTGCPVLSEADLQSRLDVDKDGAIDERFGGDDCNDRDPTIHPRAPERCDGEDNNCDDLTNEDDPRLVDADWWLDADQDGHGRADTHLRTCADIGPGHDSVWVANGDDCDDTDAEQVPGQQWDLDGDGDGFAIRVESRRLTQCVRPRGYVVALAAGEVEDCDDNDPRISPATPEVCNDRDDNCDGLVDDADPDLTDGTATYPDEDGDGWGDTTRERQSCFAQIPIGYLRRGGDCDDADPAINPEAEEVWYDDIDSDCLGDDDQDQDGDGFAADVNDCDDLQGWTYPGAPDICDGIDNGCAAGTWSQEDEETGVYFVSRNEQTAPLSFTYQLSNGGEARLVDSGVLRFCGDGPTSGTPWTGSVQLVSSSARVDVVGARGRPVLDAQQAHPLALSIDTFLTGASVENLVLRGGSHSCLSINAGTIDLTDLEIDHCGTDAQYVEPSVGGGMDLRAGTAITLTRVSVHDNLASSLGGGARLESAEVTLDDCEVYANQAPEGAGLYLAGGAVTVLNSRVYGNVATKSGGGLYVTAVELALTSSRVYENEAGLDGAGVLTLGGGTVEATEVYANVGGSGWSAAGDGDLTITTGSKIRDHLGSALVVDGATVTCSGGARFRNNEIGVFLRTGFLEGDQCDMSVDAQDNGVDVKTGLSSLEEFMYDGTATFSCNRTGCTP